MEAKNPTLVSGHVAHETHLQIRAAIALGVVEPLHEHHEDQAQEDEPRYPPHELVRSDGHGSDQAADLVQHHVASEGDDCRGVRLGLKRKRRHDELFPMCRKAGISTHGTGLGVSTYHHANIHKMCAHTGK